MGRTTWANVPTDLRSRVEQVLGGPVVDAVSQAGGYSPGGADRVTTADGTRAFVKTLSRSRNPDGHGLHEREARVVSALPSGVQAPRLRASLTAVVDGDGWIALVLDDVDGRHPGVARAGSDVAAVLDALDTLPVATGALADLPRVSSELAAVLAGLAGTFFEKAARPAPPNMPTLRGFQRSEALAAARWLLARWDG